MIYIHFLYSFTAYCKKGLYSLLQSSRTIFFLLLAISFLGPSLYANGKRNVGVLPFENLQGNSKYDWIGFGFEYLLNNKLANISDFYVPEPQIIKRALAEAGYPGHKLDGELVYHVGRSTRIEIAITGGYRTDGKNIELFVSFINSFSGATIHNLKYMNPLSDIFSMADDIAHQLIKLASLQLSPQEETIVNRKITNSVEAFEHFCLAYIENEKSKKRNEVIVGLFRRAIQADPKFWEAYYNLGIVHFNNKEYDKALEQFSKIISALPNFEKPYYGRGMIYLNKGEYENAIKDFQKVSELNPNDYKAFYFLGKACVVTKQYKEAEKQLKKAEELNPDFGPIYYEMGNIYFEQNIYTTARDRYKRATELDVENYEAHKKLGECYYRLNVYYSAKLEFTRVLEAYPNDPVANFMFGITVYKQAVLNELVEAFLEMLESDQVTNTNSVQRSSALSREKEDIYRQMAKSFNRAQQSRSNFLEATFNLALTYHEMGTLDSALIFYKKTLSIKPDLIRAHVKIAKVYEEQNERIKALDKYKEIVKIEPTYFVKQPTLGPMHQYINIIDVVLQEIDQKLKDNPNDVDANTTLAKIYYAQGFYGKAANVYRKILTINPNDQEARKMLAKLESR
jgi:tetratricopeptide (TPR) repeat protein